MPAREAERRPETDLDPAVAPEAADAQSAKFSSDGALPEVATDTEATQEATASELAFDQGAQSGDTSMIDSGMHDPAEYQAACQQAGKTDKWNDSYWFGHTEAKHFKQPYEHNESMLWTLHKGHSASQAVKDFIKGPTIADYRAMGVALELDELRDDLGDVKFDQLFGSSNSEEDAEVQHGHRLHISAGMYTTPFVDQMKAYAKERDEALAKQQEPEPEPVVEQREDKPKQPELDEQPIVVAEDLGKQPEREVV